MQCAVCGVGCAVWGGAVWGVQCVGCVQCSVGCGVWCVWFAVCGEWRAGVCMCAWMRRGGVVKHTSMVMVYGVRRTVYAVCDVLRVMRDV